MVSLGVFCSLGHHVFQLCVAGVREDVVSGVGLAQ